MTLTRTSDGPARPRPQTVEDALTMMGYWYPPDVFAAVAEGRQTYRSMAGRCFAVTHAMRANIEYARTLTRGREGA